MSLSLGVPEYAALLTFFTGALIVVNWAWIHPLIPKRPKNQFYDLADDLETLLDSLSKDVDKLGLANTYPSHNVEARARELIHKLDHLNVPHPPVEQPEVWYDRLPSLIAAARTKQLEKARRASTSP